MLIALVAWLPLALKRLPLSLPFICIALRPLPICCPEITERFTEFVVIIALMGAGLKIERLFRLGRWAVTCGWHAVPETLLKPYAPGLATISCRMPKVSIGMTCRPACFKPPNSASL